MADILGIVCARKGSKRFPGKNTKIINSKTLTERSIETLNKAGIENIVLASDFEPDFDLDKYEARHLLRPANISGDKVALQETVKWVYHSQNKHYDYIIYLMPNCPMITVKAVQQAIDIITSQRCNVVRSFNEQGHENGLIAVRTAYLEDHFIDVYCSCVICPGDEIHNEEDFIKVKKIMENSDAGLE